MSENNKKIVHQYYIRPKIFCWVFFYFYTQQSWNLIIDNDQASAEQERTTKEAKPSFLRLM